MDIACCVHNTAAEDASKRLRSSLPSPPVSRWVCFRKETVFRWGDQLFGHRCGECNSGLNSSRCVAGFESPRHRVPSRAAGGGIRPARGCDREGDSCRRGWKTQEGCQGEEGCQSQGLRVLFRPCLRGEPQRCAEKERKCMSSQC